MENINKEYLGQVKILKGVSGSGKSTLTKKLVSNEPNHAICSADDYHYFNMPQIPENYKFDINNLHIAHKTCQRKFVESLNKNVSLIIVDNTNIKLRDYKFYFLTAIEYGYEVEFHTIMGGNIEQHIKSNVHNVPRNILEKMIEGLKPCPTEINGHATKEIFYDFKKIRENQ